MRHLRHLSPGILLMAACGPPPQPYPVPRLDDRPYIAVDGASQTCAIRVLTAPEANCLPPYVRQDRVPFKGPGYLADEPTVIGRRIVEGGAHPRWLVLLTVLRDPGPAQDQRYRVEPILVAGLHTGCARHDPPTPEDIVWPCGLKDPPPPERIKRVVAIRGAGTASLYGMEAGGGVLIIEFKP